MDRNDGRDDPANVSSAANAPSYAKRVVRDWRELVIGVATLSSAVVAGWLAYVLRDDFLVAPLVIAGIAVIQAIRGLASIWSSTGVVVRAADTRGAKAGAVREPDGDRHGG